MYCLICIIYMFLNDLCVSYYVYNIEKDPAFPLSHTTRIIHFSTKISHWDSAREIPFLPGRRASFF